MSKGKSEVKRFKSIALATLFVSAAFHSGEAAARRATHHHSLRFAAASRSAFHFRHAQPAGRVIQCVAFAKAESEVVIRGNARDWWYKAAGRYARGSVPEPGSVLNFRPVRRMPLGHVAVVTGTLSSRVITIDQSHWAQNGISRNVHVVDVSPDNDWSAVRVELNGQQGSFGSIYPTFGFIYPRQENASRVEVADAWQQRMNSAGAQYAEAPDTVSDIEDGYRAPRPAVIRHRGHIRSRAVRRHR